MTACAVTTAVETGPAPFTIAADGSYAARLAGDADARYPERWTLDGPEPYAVPLPLEQPEEADSEVLPLADGRVLIHRRVADRHAFALLYPTGPRTGELPLGSVPAGEGLHVSLLPPSPDGRSAYALAVAAGAETVVWRVAGGGPGGPERVARIPGRCTGGVWLDRTGRLLALDRAQGGRTKAIAVDLGRAGEISPLLQIAEASNDRLLLADPDSGLLLIRSDAPGEQRLGWGVLGSSRPVRFPDCLRAEGATAVPFAVQPGQALMPESCAVALRLPGTGGTGPGEALALWRPADRHVFRLGGPPGWLGGAGLWTHEGRLRLPYATPDVPCGIIGLTIPQAPPPPVRLASGPRPAATRPVPLQQAPLAASR
ncbi:hypothetical protein DEJ50_23655 [Streptomyces venezuelae]|uniref:Uncharacterized protein n=1 Tax=Streptomyces venezuelae TaxID=54571 RepID=A0A5P2D8H6_STRVZ|nr:hypothetical protein [Streptomyces venezuelae]QES50368.1 hypothetical protein DEJ50_23655 [Streptomyces venezuelae]